MQSFVVAKVLIVNPDGDVLIIRRSETDDRRPLQWDLPGGFVDEGEDPVSGVIREAQEEAAATITDPRLVFGMSEMTPTFGSGTWLFFVAHVSETPTVKLSYEHDDSQWVKPEALLEHITYHRQQKMLRYVIENELLP